jgi:Ca2+-binding RTX toxin-like protein
MNSAGNSAVSAITGAAGLSSADFDIASPLKTAFNEGKSGLNTAINGISSGVGYVADADVGTALSDSVSWLGDALKTASNASGDGINWLGKYLGIDTHLSEFKGADFFVAGFLAYALGYKYAGNNRLWGGAGDDTLYSGMGNDDLHGGAGKDTYVMSMGDGKDVVHDVLKFTANKCFPR